MKTKNRELFNDALLTEIREKFAYIDRDPLTNEKRIFFDNAGGSFRLKRANERFAELDQIPNCPMREHKQSIQLQAIDDKGIDDARIIFNAKEGSIVPYYTASKSIFTLTGVIAEHSAGTNIVTTELEHPSAFDAATFYAEKEGKELRVAKTNRETGGVDVEEITKHIDEETSFLSVIYASNISGAILDVEAIVREARKIKPDLYIIVDAVQHAPHGVIDLEKTPVDVMNFAPYKFFGVRGSGIAYVSDRVAAFPHHRLYGKDDGELHLGSSTPGHFASITEVVDYVCWIGGTFSDEDDRRQLFVRGMERIALHERALLELLLNGTERVRGLRDMSGVTVYLDYEDLTKRDLIVAMEIDDMDFQDVTAQYEAENVIVYDRVATSIYSKRMLESFGLSGTIRVSPLHCHTVEEIEGFLKITEMIVDRHQK